MTVNEKCERLHQLFNGMELHRFERSDIQRLGFDNGVYIVFEEGEKAHGGNRIVRVGTTTGNKTILADRLLEHYEDEGRSIFRNHIALCLLKKNGDPYNLMGLFLKSKIDRNKWKKTANNEELKAFQVINETVSSYIRKNCSFAAFPVGKEFRRSWETRIISTVYSCPNCEASENWLGNISLRSVSPRREIICRSGLWNVQGVNNKNVLTGDELAELEKIVKLSGGKSK
jgi:hypothetical protein